MTEKLRNSSTDGVPATEHSSTICKISEQLPSGEKYIHQLILDIRVLGKTRLAVIVLQSLHVVEAWIYQQ